MQLSSHSSMAVGTIRILLAAVIMLDCSCSPKERKMIFDDCDSISPSVVYFKACNINDPIVFKVDDTYYVAPSNVMDIIDTSNNNSIVLDIIDTLNINSIITNMNQFYPIHEDYYDSYCFLIESIPLEMYRENYSLPLTIEDFIAYQKTEGKVEFYQFLYQPKCFMEAFVVEPLKGYEIVEGNICAVGETSQYYTYRIHLKPVFEKSIVHKTMVDHYKKLYKRIDNEAENEFIP